jgi:M6 family metalloprotease-like protein
MFNSTSAGYNSMVNYFREVSYNRVSIGSTFYPLPGGGVTVSYQDVQPRGYYSPYNGTTNPAGYQTDSERTTREHTLLKNAVDAVSAQVPASLNIDADNDGRVDGMVFIVRGSNNAWSSLLWPHAWSLYSYNVQINGKRVYSYSFQIESMTGNSVLCHEMGHNMGFPDLYRYYDNSIVPVGSWDVMASNTNTPQHPGAYMKYKYTGWIDSIPKISASGAYSLSPLSSAANNVYRIDSPNSASEFFILEFRKKGTTFETGIPGEGLLMYRINTAADGNADGPPDEIYLYRPGGTSTLINGTISQAHYSSNAGRTSINNATTPSSFLSDDTPGGLDIYSIGSVGNTMTFSVRIAGSPACTYQINPAIISLNAAGGTGSLSVITQPGCAWTASEALDWFSITAGSSGTGSGTVSYSVLQNASGTPRSGSITIAGQSVTVQQSMPALYNSIGVYSNGLWYLDNNSNKSWDGQPVDVSYAFGFPGAMPVLGDWSGSGAFRIGVFANGYWYLDMNGNGVWDGEPADKVIHFGFAGAVPVVGDWNNTGASKIGVYANGYWYLDQNGNGVWDGEPADRVSHFGFPGATAVTGDWTGSGLTRVGVYSGGDWYLDINGNGLWDGEPTDKVYHFGFEGATPVLGGWAGSSATRVGVYADGYWYLDMNGNGLWEGEQTDDIIHFGFSGALPVAR